MYTEGCVLCKSSLAEEAANACLEHIDKHRDKLFNDLVNDFCNNKDVGWFKRMILLNQGRESIIHYLKNEVHWFLPNWKVYKYREYNAAQDLLNLSIAEYIWIGPNQAKVIQEFQSGEYDES